MSDDEIKARAMAALLGVEMEVFQQPLDAHIYLRESPVSRDYWACHNWAEVIERLKEITVDFGR